MTYIAEPGIDVLDRSCVEERRSTASMKRTVRSVRLPGGPRSLQGHRQ